MRADLKPIPLMTPLLCKYLQQDETSSTSVGVLDRLPKRSCRTQNLVGFSKEMKTLSIFPKQWFLFQKCVRDICSSRNQTYESWRTFRKRLQNTYNKEFAVNFPHKKVWQAPSKMKCVIDVPTSYLLHGVTSFYRHAINLLQAAFAMHVLEQNHGWLWSTR